MQQRQSPELPIDSKATAAPRSRQRIVSSLLTSAGASLLALFAVGCPQPADLENADDPNVYPADPSVKGSTGGGGSGGSGGGSTSTCEVSCVPQVLTKSCTMCHGKLLKSASLDLENAGLTGRLKDIPATHQEVADASGCPTGDKLIDSSNSSQSWFLKKLKNDFGTCGNAMPIGVPLNATDLKCMEDYVACVAGGTPSGGGGAATGGGGAASGGGGAASAGGGAGGTGGA